MKLALKFHLTHSTLPDLFNWQQILQILQNFSTRDAFKEFILSRTPEFYAIKMASNNSCFD